MKKIFTFLSCIIIINANAQNGKSVKSSSATHTLTSASAGSVKLGWGESNKVEKDLAHETVFGDMTNGIFSIRTQNKNIYFTKYTGNLKTAIEKPIKLPLPDGAEEGDVAFKSALYIGGTIYIAETYYNKKAETGYLYFCKVSRDGDVDPNLVQMDKIEGFKKSMTTGGNGQDQEDVGIISTYSNSWTGDPEAAFRGKSTGGFAENGFRAILSVDSTKILIIHHATADKKDMERFSCTVTDANLKQLWSKTIELPYTNKEFSLENVKVDNDGNSVFIGVKKLEGDEKTGKAKYDYRMVAYYWHDELVKEYTFDLGDKIINNLYFTFDSASDIRVGGFYTNKKSDRTDGYFYTTIDKATKSVGTKIVNDFEADFAKKYKFATNKGELKNFVLNNIYSSPNGNLILIAEQRQVEEVSMASPGGPMGTMPGSAPGGMTGSYGTSMTRLYSSGVNFIANDILVFCLKPNGDLIWSTTIPKKQLMTRREYESYIFLHDKDNLYFLYNDNPNNANLDREKVSRYSNQNKTAIMLATITADGKVTRKELPQPEENEDHLALNIKMIADVGNKNFAVVGRAKSQYRIGVAQVK